MEREDKSKQVIVLRKDLKMRKGKMVAQGGHGVVAFLARGIQAAFRLGKVQRVLGGYEVTLFVSDDAYRWMVDGRFTKICVGVETGEELDALHHAARERGVTAELIVDSGLTEFGGIPTKTCVVVGPNLASVIDPITGHLKPL